MTKKTKETLLELTKWTPNFEFLSSQKYFVCKSGSNKDKNIAGHLVSLVLGKMWYRSQGYNQICKSSVGTIARELGLSKNTVKRAVEILEQLEIVQDTKVLSEFGTNQYWVFEETIIKYHEAYEKAKVSKSSNDQGSP